MRFLFYYPYAERPVGGIKQIRYMVRALGELGCDARILREKRGFDDNTFYDVAVEEAPFTFAEVDSNLSESDIIVLPECGLDRLLDKLANCKARRALNNQNGYFFLRHRPEHLWNEAKIDFAIVNSETVGRLTKRFLGLPESRIFHVPHLVSRGPFAAPLQRLSEKELAIAYMPRKLPELTEEIRSRVLTQRPDVKWLKIDGVPETTVANIMSQCQVFLSTHHEEGCPLPSLEAMACGCIVAGFAGTPGFRHPYATRTNGFWAKDEDVSSAVKQVLLALDVAEGDKERASEILDAGRETAARFSPKQVKRALRPVVEAASASSFPRRRESFGRLTLSEYKNALRILHRNGRKYWRQRIVKACKSAFGLKLMAGRHKNV